MSFTDAHSPATVCTPSRYSILTGRMEFRTGVPGVFTGAGGPGLIEESRLTLPGMLRAQGYRTALYGKWHVGLSFPDREGRPINENGFEPVARIDYTRAIPDAPIHRGFDHFYGTACCPTTDFLYAFIDGDRIPVPPTRLHDRAGLPDHPYARDNRIGWLAPGFDFEEIDMVFLQRSVRFLERHAAASPEKPLLPVSLHPGRTPAVVPRQGVSGQDRRRTARRLHLRVRLRRRRAARHPGAAGIGRGYAGHGDQRQRTGSYQRREHAPGLRARRRAPVARDEARSMGRRTPRALHRALAAAYRRREQQCSDGLPVRPDGDLRGADGRRLAQRRGRGQLRHPAGDARPDPGR